MYIITKLVKGVKQTGILLCLDFLAMSYLSGMKLIHSLKRLEYSAPAWYKIM